MGYPKIEKFDTETDTETQGCAKFDSDTDTRHFGIAIPKPIVSPTPGRLASNSLGAIQKGRPSLEGGRGVSPKRRK